MKDGESRTYTIPLRKEWLKVPKWRRSKRAATTLRNFLAKHTKAKEIRLGKWANELLWEKGSKNPPAKITITVKKEKDIATAELAVLPAKAKRLAKEEKKRAEERKKKEAEKKKKEEEKKKEEKEHKDKKAKEKEDIEKAKKKKKAKVTKQQEMAMQKR
ncbi:hypothetical protein GF374_00135 [Candidatus Woesearchaeota archaeon]|nr:hypothetical protein [Candidatus Woesearchaeota archaeon]